MNQVDFLIVGQGLAGSLLAMRLLQAGQRVQVIDNRHLGSASQVAAGIINPITGHRLNKTHGFDTYIEAALDCYSSLEKRLEANSIVRPVKQVRLVKNPGQAEYLQKRLNDPDYQRFISVSEKQNTHTPKLQDLGFGAIGIKQTWLVDAPRLLSVISQHLDSLGALRQEPFAYTKLQLTSNGVLYQDTTAKAVIFCEGYQAIYNPWLEHLPFKLSRGDVLTVEPKELDPYRESQAINQELQMLNWGSWLVQDQHEASDATRFKLGSSYEWNSLDLQAKAENATKLLASAALNTGEKMNLIRHQVGIRPTTTQRRPFIGPLSNLDHAYCFNGFGSKGCLLIPFYAEHLVSHLLCASQIDEELSKWV